MLILFAAIADASKLRVGVIGTGCIGLEHLRNLNLVKLATIAAICDSHGPSLHAGMETLEGMGIPAADVVCCSDYHELLALPQVEDIVATAQATCEGFRGA